MKKIILALLLIGCSNSKVLYTHSDNMSRLVSKQLVIDRFGEPTSISSDSEIDEYYYDFGTWNQTVNYYDPKMSLVGETSYSEYQQPTTSAVRTEYKYVKFQMIKDSIIYWESKGVNFSTKKKKSQQ